MKKLMLVLLLLVSANINAQDKNLSKLSLDKEYRNSIKEFYRLLFSEKKVSIKEADTVYSYADLIYDSQLKRKIYVKQKKQHSQEPEISEIRGNEDTITSFVFTQFKKYKTQLAQNYDFNAICKLIDSALIYKVGITPSFINFELKFSDFKTVNFDMDEKDAQIDYIWLPNCTSLLDVILGDSIGSLSYIGTIGDKYAPVNVMINPDINTYVVCTIEKGDLIRYMPVGDEEWWRVRKLNNNLSSHGYVQINKIIQYKDLPPPIKDKADEWMKNFYKDY